MDFRNKNHKCYTTFADSLSLLNGYGSKTLSTRLTTAINTYNRLTVSIHIYIYISFWFILFFSAELLNVI